MNKSKSRAYAWRWKKEWKLKIIEMYNRAEVIVGIQKENKSKEMCEPN
jgi:hypothetical protein